MFNKISVYIILYHDNDFLEDIINQLYDFVDEIIIIDGPYNYSLNTFKTFDLFYDENNKPSNLEYIINKFSKIKYEYKIFENEEEKRIYAYNKCSNNNILVVDSDEFFVLDKKCIGEFIQTENKYVGRFDIYNMNRININYNERVQKLILFKKIKIDARTHLDYLWLIGCKQNKPIPDYIYNSLGCNNSLGVIYHQTLNRTKFNNIVKFIFYTSLYKHANNKKQNLLNNYENDELLTILSKDEILDIFYHDKIEAIGIPENKMNNIWTFKDDVMINLEKYKNNQIEGYFDKSKKCLQHVKSCFLLDMTKYKETITIHFNNVKKVSINLYEININEKYKISNYTFSLNIDNNTISINHNIIKAFCVAIQINCSQTLNSDILFDITTIL